MNTTSLLVDILIIGIQVLIWLLGFIFSFVFKLETVASYFKEFPSAMIIFILSLSYTLGIMFDYIIPVTLKKLEKKINKKILFKQSGNVIDILNNNPDIHKFLDNHFSRLRIARATVFNIPLITISMCLFIISRNFSFGCEVLISLIIVLLTGTLFTILGYKSWENRKKVYSKYIYRAYEIANKKVN